jgi:hypothetical protein
MVKAVPVYLSSQLESQMSPQCWEDLPDCLLKWKSNFSTKGEDWPQENLRFREPADDTELTDDVDPRLSSSNSSMLLLTPEKERMDRDPLP